METTAAKQNISLTISIKMREREQHAQLDRNHHNNNKTYFSNSYSSFCDSKTFAGHLKSFEGKNKNQKNVQRIQRKHRQINRNEFISIKCVQICKRTYAQINQTKYYLNIVGKKHKNNNNNIHFKTMCASLAWYFRRCATVPFHGI